MSCLVAVPENDTALLNQTKKISNVFNRLGVRSESRIVKKSKLVKSLCSTINKITKNSSENNELSEKVNTIEENDCHQELENNELSEEVNNIEENDCHQESGITTYSAGVLCFSSKLPPKSFMPTDGIFGPNVQRLENNPLSSRLGKKQIIENNKRSLEVDNKSDESSSVSTKKIIVDTSTLSRFLVAEFKKKDYSPKLTTHKKHITSKPSMISEGIFSSTKKVNHKSIYSRIGPSENHL